MFDTDHRVGPAGPSRRHVTSKDLSGLRALCETEGRADRWGLLTTT